MDILSNFFHFMEAGDDGIIIFPEPFHIDDNHFLQIGELIFNQEDLIRLFLILHNHKSRLGMIQDIFYLDIAIRGVNTYADPPPAWVAKSA